MPKSYLTKTVNGREWRIHRFVMTRHLGRELTKDEVVHHKNHDIHDNRISNLEVLNRSEHMKRHRVEIEFGNRFTRNPPKDYQFEIQFKLKKSELKKLQDEGIKMSEIAKIYGCHFTTIKRNLIKYGIPVRRRSPKTKGWVRFDRRRWQAFRRENGSNIYLGTAKTKEKARLFLLT